MTDSKRELLVPSNSALIPRYVVDAGGAAGFAWEEYFLGRIGNPHTRKAYQHAVIRFLHWCEAREVELTRITPGLGGQYFNSLPLSSPSKKLHLAGCRAFFDVLVERHVVVLNPLHAIRTERYSAVEGRTPAISVEQARQLLKSIELHSLIDLRDRALLGVLVYTIVRESAAAALRLCDFMSDGRQYQLNFLEKGGKARTIPVRHDLQHFFARVHICHGARSRTAGSSAVSQRCRS